MKLKHILLGLSFALVGVSFLTTSIYLDAALPVGTILFGLFMVVTVMEKENALYDEQLGHATAPAKAQKARKNFREVAANPVLTRAHSH